MVIAVVLLAVAAVAVAVAAGCGSSVSPEQAKQQLNTDLTNLKDSLSAFTNPATYTSKTSVESAVDTVQTDINAVVSSAKEVKSVSSSALTSAWNDLKKSVTDTVNSSASISEKLDSITTAVKDFQQAWQQLVNDLKTK